VEPRTWALCGALSQVIFQLSRIEVVGKRCPSVTSTVASPCILYFISRAATRWTWADAEIWTLWMPLEQWRSGGQDSFRTCVAHGQFIRLCDMQARFTFNFNHCFRFQCSPLPAPSLFYCDILMKISHWRKNQSKACWRNAVVEANWLTDCVLVYCNCAIACSSTYIKHWIVLTCPNKQ